MPRSAVAPVGWAIQNGTQNFAFEIYSERSVIRKQSNSWQPERSFLKPFFAVVVRLLERKGLRCYEYERAS